MRAISLLAVFILAKILVLAGHPVPLSAWTLFAYFWQDVIAAAVFATLDAAIGRRWFGWTLYAAAVGYVAINIPIARFLSSPLTWPMLKATGGALSDSILHHATPTNLGIIALIVGAGAVFPFALARLRSFPLPGNSLTRWGVVVVATALMVLLGHIATAKIDTIGLHRNPLTAIVISSMPRLSVNASPREVDGDWRDSPFPDGVASKDIERLRGAAGRRNVVLVLLESTGAGYLKPYGAKVDPMPRLTELARNAIVFENAYAVYPESVKTLFSVLSAVYPVLNSSEESYTRVSTPSIADALKKAGYTTGLFHSGRFMYLGMEAVIERRGYDVLEDAGAISGVRESSFGVDEPSTVRRMLSWVDSLPQEKSFFLTYLPIAGHHPYDTPERGPFAEIEERDRYLNALNYSDLALSSLIEGLRKRGLVEKTLFVICGDHGEAFGQHDGNYGHSTFVYEENIRVPFIIAAPGLLTEEVRVNRSVSLIDTAPTILDLLGLEIPRAYQGRSMLESERRMALFFTDYSLSLLGLRDGCWKYVYELDSERSKLFNLCDDPEERRDLYRQNTARSAEYRTRLVDWSAAQSAR